MGNTAYIRNTIYLKQKKTQELKKDYPIIGKKGHFEWFEMWLDKSELSKFANSR